MDNALKEEIDREFKDAGHLLDDKLLDECVSICDMYAITPESLRFTIEAINYKPSTTLSRIAPITMDTLSAVKVQQKQKLTKENAQKGTLRPGAFSIAKVDRNKFGSNIVSRGFTGAGGSKPIPIKQEPAGEANVIPEGHTIQTSNVSFVGPPTDPESRKRRAYRYMYEKISERSESLDQLIDDFAELIRLHYDVAEFADPHVQGKEVTIIGRIIHDPEAAAMSKLVEGAIAIESSRMLSKGERTQLVLDPTIKIRGGVKGVGGVGLFPGGIVALKGKNGGGKYFLATEVLAIPPLKPSPLANGIVDPKLDPLSSQIPINMLIVCGPYTSDSDVVYRPWRSLLHQIKAQKPDVLLLVGPFVDSAHPKIKAGEVEVSPTNLFRAHFVDPIKAFLTTSPGSIVLMIPSVRDLVSTHAAYPQPELDTDVFNSEPRVHLLPNPARFSINDISFAVTSVDTLFHLRKEEYFKRGIEIDSLPSTPEDLPDDAMANLSRYILLQRSFYPIFPPPQDLASEVNLDMSHFDDARLVDEGDLDYAPDVLILPSRLKHFSKLIHSTTVVNPSFLSKGTYSKIAIAPRFAGVPKQRLSVEITRQEIPIPVPTSGTAT